MAAISYNNTTVNEVDAFKNIYCNENEIIKALLSKSKLDLFNEVILDVGSGTGDILSYVIPLKKVIYLDINDYSKYVTPPDHSRLTLDFLKFDPSNFPPIQTVFISHTLQFIDSDIHYLNRITNSINPKNIVLILNNNDDFLANLINFSLTNFRNTNAEIIHNEFPSNYIEAQRIHFSANLVCSNFDILASQVQYLMGLYPLNHLQHIKIREYLIKQLSKPEFTINQSIINYVKR